MQTEPLLTWSEPATELLGFIALFLANGSIGFRYAALRGRLASAGADDDLVGVAARRAGRLGLLGALVQAVLLVTRLPHLAERMHLTTAQLVTTDPQTIARCGLLLVGIVGLALAATGRRSGWGLAAVGVIGSELSGVLAGKWERMVNPVHMLLAGLWLGTLAVLVLAGITTALRGDRRGRGAAVAEMVNGFSPLALTCGPLLIATGVITALRHLTPFSSLWTTPYGYALLLKLCLVAATFALGAWNWRRQRPQLGSDAAAGRLLRSSVLELAAALSVLTVTAVLVSLPSPKG
jgi:putative copper export protein